MPDHLHFLCEGLHRNCDLRAFVRAFKIRTGRAHTQKTGAPLWQKKYYDHIIRPQESMEAIAWYIWMNPVRKGLSAAVGEYLFAGSFTRLASQMTSPSTPWLPPWASHAPASEGGRYTTRNIDVQSK